VQYLSTSSSSSHAPVSFLNAKPSIAMRLPVIVLNMRDTMMFAKRDFWKSFILMTPFQ
jgi:hypothetical protein